MRTIIRLAVSAGLLSLCGCVTATYTYTVTDPNGRSCSLLIESKRDLPGGFAGSIESCNLIAETPSATGGQFDTAQLMAIATMFAPYIRQATVPADPSIPTPTLEQPK